MTKKRFLFLFVLGLECLLALPVFAQTTYEIKMGQATIYGKSNLHDWQAETNSFSGSCIVKNAQISDVIIVVDALSIRGSKGSTMDEKIQETLQAQKYGQIIFRSVKNESVELSNGVQKVRSYGKIIISGQSQEANLVVDCRDLPSGDIEAFCQFELTMSSFGLTPPTAILGALKVHDKIKVEIKITFQKKN